MGQAAVYLVVQQSTMDLDKHKVQNNWLNEV